MFIIAGLKNVGRCFKLYFVPLNFILNCFYLKNYSFEIDNTKVSKSVKIIQKQKCEYMGVNIKLFWKFIFYIYILLVINFVIFKFFGDINSVKNNIQLTYESINNGGSNLNLIPFRTIFSYGPDLYMEISFINIVGNIIPFIPLGFLIPVVFPTRKPFIKTMTSCFGIIICIEVIQLITFLGRMDIDDVILNQISCVIGYLLYIVFKKIFGNKLGIQQKSS